MDWINEDGTRCDPQPTEAEVAAIRRLYAGEMPAYGTSVGGEEISGYGALDDKGNFEFPLPRGFHIPKSLAFPETMGPNGA